MADTFSYLLAQGSPMSNNMSGTMGLVCHRLYVTTSKRRQLAMDPLFKFKISSTCNAGDCPQLSILILIFSNTGRNITSVLCN